MPDAVCLDGGNSLDTLTPEETPDTVQGRGQVGSVVRGSTLLAVDESSILCDVMGR